ncbi:MAG: dienelactone hydrolase family protein [Gammaproteobacteria bacterium]|jgi:dienelactone hydrolase
MTDRLVEYEHEGVVLEGFLALPEGETGARPGVAIAHAWGGRGELEQAVAVRLAALGYGALALDMFGKGVRGASREENAALIAPFLEDRNLLQARMSRAISVLREQPEIDPNRIAAIGYCFGGLCVLDLARSGADVGGVVSIHGLFNPPEPPPGVPITAKVLALHGHEDPMVPVEAVNRLEQELTGAGADWQIHVYGGAMHAFTNPQANDPDFGTVYNETADRRSWATLVAFLSEVLA